MADYSYFDNMPNESEGWAIFHTTGTGDTGDWRIEMVDEEGKFDTDQDAWEFVLRKALVEKSGHHQRAIGFIARHNSDEYERIENHAAYLALIEPGETLMSRLSDACL